LGSAAANSYVEASLFPALAVARELKRRDPSKQVVLAGFGGVSYGLARPLLDEYPFLDRVFEGEIEGQVVDWLRRRNDPAAPVPVTSGVDVGDLPTPDFSAFAAWAESSPLVLKWSIPIESARGCWWDRVERRDDAFATCFFCNRHGSHYREKSPERVAGEMAEQARRYGHARFDFADSLVRLRNVEEAADAILAQGMPFAFLQHARAQITPYEILRLWEAGMLSAQIGVEGLSTPFLERIGKGTTTIQNLQAMKIFYELKITHVASNLLADFPGATAEEVEETAANIRRYAIAYQPLQISPFWLIRTTTVERHPEHFGIRRLRNRDGYRLFLPEDVYERLPLPLMDFDVERIGDSDGPEVSWGPVRRAVAEWERRHQELGKRVLGAEYHHASLLYYRDHGVSLEIVDRREGMSVYTLEPAWREVYLFAAEVRERREIERQFADRYSADQVAEILEQCAGAHLMFRERDRFLSLATALYPHWAARRIRQAHDNPRSALPATSTTTSTGTLVDGTA
ncbi:MAG: hypothetical protein MI919_40280, partial [Holophagales bacterium]|nr:hypothetical protein [Holophagales bacterium]